MPKVALKRRNTERVEDDPVRPRVCTRTWLQEEKKRRCERQRFYREQSFKAQGKVAPPVTEEGRCRVRLGCGHPCGGVTGEKDCPPCLHSDCRRTGQTGSDTCVICYTDTLAEAPVIQLVCSHIFHKTCIVQVVEGRWPGANITFSFLNCPLCKNRISHTMLEDILAPIQRLLEQVEQKALQRLQYEGQDNHPDLSVIDGPFYNNPIAFALSKYAYYMCFKCSKPFYGGEIQCERQAADDNVKLEELICGACSNVGRAQNCRKHGNDHIEYKCRYCCSIAVFFCFGTTHFCNKCHDLHVYVRRLADKKRLPPCPAGPGGVKLSTDSCPLNIEHPPSGEEFALGCGLCANEATF